MPEHESPPTEYQRRHPWLLSSDKETIRLSTRKVIVACSHPKNTDTAELRAGAATGREGHEEAHKRESLTARASAGPAAPRLAPIRGEGHHGDQGQREEHPQLRGIPLSPVEGGPRFRFAVGKRIQHVVVEVLQGVLDLLLLL